MAYTNYKNIVLSEGEHALLTDMKTSNELQLWHERLGHVRHQTIVQAVQKGILKLPTKKPLQEYMTNLQPCKTCAESKITRKSVPKTSNIKEKARGPFDIVCMDIGGPVEPQTQIGHRWFLVIVCIYSNGIWVYTLRTKGDAPKAFRTFVTENLGTHSIGTIRRIRSDRAPELYQGEMKEIFEELKIVSSDTTAPDASYQNSRAERAIRTATTMARSLMNHSKAPPPEWGPALCFGARIIRHLPSAGNPNSEAPFQRLGLCEQAVDVSDWKTWYSPVYYFEQRPKTERFLNQGQKGNFIDFLGGNKKAYVIRTATGGTVHKAARDVYFIENKQTCLELYPEH